MLVEFGAANLLNKALQQPEKVKKVVEKFRTDGIAETLDAVKDRLGRVVPLGYCNVGTVVAAGPGVTGFQAGDRVVSNGGHAEIISVPVNLCARVPTTVSDAAAPFTVLGAIGLQGIRLVQPTLGETIVVSGLGIIGLLTVQLLRAHGCRVLGIDLDAERLGLAREFGAQVVDLSTEDAVTTAKLFSRGRGVDAVIIAASTDSSEPVHQAAEMCRKRGRIVMVGVTGLKLSRSDFYEKELTFQVSCSYGPGRYDHQYEEKGIDYPVGFVRWTQQRNFEAVLDMMAENRIDVDRLISHRFKIGEAEQAYRLITSKESSLGILLEYPFSQAVLERSTYNKNPERRQDLQAVSTCSVNFIGAGNYATRTLIPAFSAAGADLIGIASQTGITSAEAAKKFGFEVATTDTQSLISDEVSNALVITTRHDSHAQFVLEALEAGKHVFVEKPLCLTLEEADKIEVAWRNKEVSNEAPLLMVGFNRRFAPQIQKIQSLLQSVSGAKSFVMTVNAGDMASDHWVRDRSTGGGRILGEACHFIDLLRCLSGVPIADATIMKMADDTGDTATIQLRFEDGSIGSLNYLSNGSRTFPKERLEVFCAGRILQLDNFRKLKGFGWPGFRRMNLWSQDKGQKACVQAFLRSIREGRRSPIPIEEILEVSRVTIALANEA